MTTAFRGTSPTPAAVAPVSDAVVATYRSPGDTAQGVRALAQAGCDLRAVSIVGQESVPAPAPDAPAGAQQTGWLGAGELRGGLWSLVSPSARFTVPRVGPVFIGGPLVGWTMRALHGAAALESLRVVGAALAHLGIPAASTGTYEAAIEAGRFVLVAHGTMAQVEQARAALARGPHDTLDAHPSRYA